MNFQGSGEQRMAARILDGRIIAADVRADLEPIASTYQQAHGRPATLAILAVGRDPASSVYANALRRAAASLHMDVRLIQLHEGVSDADLRYAIEDLNAEPNVQGILVEFPLPGRLSQQVVAEAIDPRKDVDGIGVRNLGALFLRLPSFVSATCAAVLEILDRSEITVADRRVVVVGASNVVGKPLAFLLLHRDATVTVCHIDTRDLAHWTRQADVLIVAVGRPNLITAAMVKPGAVVVDVGINVREDGVISGDVAFDEVAAVAGAITPAPGGVGQLTNLMLLRQTLLAGDLLDQLV
jgi:methylenetetrahydrofolate dehydrogenase (NADP+)/methenyltetrahydrofolate cyclohydrolase